MRAFGIIGRNAVLGIYGREYAWGHLVKMVASPPLLSFRNEKINKARQAHTVRYPSWLNTGITRKERTLCWVVRGKSLKHWVAGL